MVGSGAALRSFFQFQWFYQKWSMGKVGQRAAHTSVGWLKENNVLCGMNDNLK